jgi:hypothetical protein
LANRAVEQVNSRGVVNAQLRSTVLLFKMPVVPEAG